MIETYQDKINAYYLSFDEVDIPFSSDYKIKFDDLKSLSKEVQFVGLEPFYDGIAQRIKQLKVAKEGLAGITENYQTDLINTYKE